MADDASIQRQADFHNVRPATADEIARMSDAQSIGKIDELRAAAMQAADAGDIAASRLYWHNACTIAMFNYVGTDVLAECADFLEEHDLPDLAETYRDYHRQLTGFLRDYGLPKPDYDDRLRAENARDESDRATPVPPRASLVSEARNARAAADCASRDVAPEPRRSEDLGLRS